MERASQQAHHDGARRPERPEQLLTNGLAQGGKRAKYAQPCRLLADAW
jgi:hypothetical protein